MKYHIVTEKCICSVDYLVFAKSSEDAIEQVKNGSDDQEAIDVHPVYIKTSSSKVRVATDKDFDDAMVARIKRYLDVKRDGDGEEIPKQKKRRKKDNTVIDMLMKGEI